MSNIPPYLSTWVSSRYLKCRMSQTRFLLPSQIAVFLQSCSSQFTAALIFQLLRHKMLVWLSTLLFYIPTSHTPANQNTFLKIPGTWSLLPSLQQLPWCPLLLPWKKKRKWSRSVLSNSLWFYGLYSLPGSSIHGIFQAKILEWVTISFSKGSSQRRDWTQVSHIAGRLFTIWVTGKPLYCEPAI